MSLSTEPRQETLFALIARYVYPKNYRFDEDDVAVYKDAVRLAHVSDCQPLAEVNLDAMFDWPVGHIRAAIGLEVDLLRAYYAVEGRRYPACAESQRLLA